VDQDEFIANYPVNGSNKIANKIGMKDWEITDPQKQVGRVWINDDQYFEGIPDVVWENYIGGYQPIQKWLKDQFDRVLSFEDILHYQKIIVVLYKTQLVAKELEKNRI